MKPKIIDTSKKLFQKFGYKKTTLTDIAKSVGKVKTAIYYYFSGKEEIFATLVKMEAEAFLNGLIQEMEKYDDPLKKLEIYIETRVLLMQKISDRYSFLRQEFFELMPLVEESRKEYDQLEIEYIENVIKKGIEKSGFKNEGADFSTKLLVNSLKGLEVQMYVTNQVIIGEKDMDKFKNFLLYGIINQSKIKKSRIS